MDTEKDIISKSRFPQCSQGLAAVDVSAASDQSSPSEATEVQTKSRLSRPSASVIGGKNRLFPRPRELAAGSGLEAG